MISFFIHRISDEPVCCRLSYFSKRVRNVHERIQPINIYKFNLKTCLYYVKNIKITWKSEFLKTSINLINRRTSSNY